MTRGVHPVVERRRAAVVGAGMMMVMSLLLAVIGSVPGASAATAPTINEADGAAASTHPPTFAYFYIWFDPTSWNRAKSDLPLAGKYSSDERTVMQEQVRTAKAAGLDGFIVSWKSSEKLDRRLGILTEIAEENDFRLIVIYQGLDFAREPLPVSRVHHDLDYFATTFASSPAYAVFDRPAVVISGSWRFSPEEIGQIGAGLRSKLLILASEKDTEGIDRLAGLIDGNAYYWSSVNPDTYPKYQDKLNSMSAAVHGQGGVWIAPAAAGFDARMVGGQTVVDRKDGGQLRTQYAAATASQPDAVGIISWNEFSENSHIEPSREFGTTYVDVTASLLGGLGPLEAHGDGFDSSEPGDRGSGRAQLVAIVVIALIVLGAVWLIVRRRVGGLSDAGLPEGGLSDAGPSDAGLSDAGLSDAGVSDAGLSEAGGLSDVVESN